VPIVSPPPWPFFSLARPPPPPPHFFHLSFPAMHRAESMPGPHCGCSDWLAGPSAEQDPGVPPAQYPVLQPANHHCASSDHLDANVAPTCRSNGGKLRSSYTVDIAASDATKRKRNTVYKHEQKAHTQGTAPASPPGPALTPHTGHRKLRPPQHPLNARRGAAAARRHQHRCCGAHAAAPQLHASLEH
jgi:hypothetical protein